ncbi:MAG: FeoA domain-containing protein [Anaerolineae bacterium]|nr:FeoA domain-containing protein [Anaerolineae bacterium]
MITTNERILSEDVLKHIYKCEKNNRRPTMESIAGVLQIKQDEASTLVSKMAAHNLLTLQGDEFHLTEAGQDYALQVIRAHRLWERYLADETGFDEAQWHVQAEQHEHHLTPDEVEALAARLGYPTHDPHGDPIPSASGQYVPHGGQPLTALEPGQYARIVHIEDEPPIVYAQLVAEGLYPDTELRLKEISTERVRFLVGDTEHRLAPIVARNISVLPLSPEEVTEQTNTERLSNLKIGETAQVVRLSPACRGPERRRFMDLGILPGTVITAEMVSPSGDPTAYLIRRSLIGLRKEQADQIHITRDVVKQ